MARRDALTYNLEIVTHQFMLTIFMGHKELELIQIVYKADIESKEPQVYRLVVAEKNTWGGVDFKDMLNPYWPRLVQLASEEVSNGFKPKNRHYAAGRHQDSPGVSRFTPENNPLGHTGHSLANLMQMFGLDDEDDDDSDNHPPLHLNPTNILDQLAKASDLAAAFRQGGSEESRSLVDHLVNELATSRLFESP